MSHLTILSPSDQVATHLRGELLRGCWSGEMPGTPMLSAELGVDRKTIMASLDQLEREGLLVSQGVGRRRRIVPPEGKLEAPPLRVAILDYEQPGKADGYIIELTHMLTEAGHGVLFSHKCLLELGMEVRRIARMVEKTEADAWVVRGGSREVIEWFAGRSDPALALFGRRRGVPIAAVGPDKPPVLAETTRRLIELGHQRIVFLVRSERRIPEPGATERAFLDELEAHGIPPGSYNMPDWEESVAGFHEGLEKLFRHTPPSALIVDEAPFFTATLQFCLGRGIQVPQEVSLVCTDGDPHFDWFNPSVAHIRWDSRPVVRRIVRWADNVARGKADRRQTLTKAEFVEGGTIGPVRRR